MVRGRRSLTSQGVRPTGSRATAPGHEDRRQPRRPSRRHRPGCVRARGSPAGAIGPHVPIATACIRTARARPAAGRLGHPGVHRQPEGVGAADGPPAEHRRSSGALLEASDIRAAGARVVPRQPRVARPRSIRRSIERMGRELDAARAFGAARSTCTSARTAARAWRGRGAASAEAIARILEPPTGGDHGRPACLVLEDLRRPG